MTTALLGELITEPRFRKLDKGGQDLVAALVETLGKGLGVHDTPDPDLSEWSRLFKADPTPGDVHVSTELSDLSVAYIQDASNFAASGAGLVPVDRQSDAYMEYDRADLFRVDEDDALRGPSSESAGSGFSTTFPTYSCKTYAWHKDVDEQLEGNQRVGDPVDDALMYVTQIMTIIREKVWVNTLFKAGVFDTDQTGVAAAPGANQFLQWNQSAAIPRNDISAQAVKIHEQTGRWPNVLALQPRVLLQLLLNAQIVDAFKYTTAGATPNLNELAAALCVGSVLQATPPEIKVVGGSATTSRKGAATAISYIGGKAALLAYVNPNPGLRSPSAWYTFSWAGLLGANAYGARVKDFEIVERAITHRIEEEMSFDIKLVSSLLGVFFATAVA